MSLRCKTVFIALADLADDTLKNFYAQLFERTPTIEIPHVYTEFDLPGVHIGIFRPKDTDQAEFLHKSSGSLSLCIEVETLEGAIAHLTTLGYPPLAEIQHTAHGREIYTYDPQGNRLILHEESANQPHLLQNH